MNQVMYVTLQLLRQLKQSVKDWLRALKVNNLLTHYITFASGTSMLLGYQLLGYQLLGNQVPSLEVLAIEDYCKIVC